MSDDHEGLVHPERAAQRAAEELVAGRPRAAISELLHGLGSLARQHNALVERVKRLEGDRT